MNLEGIYHRVNSNYAYLVEEDRVLLKLRTKRDDLNSVKVFHCDKYRKINSCEDLKIVEMTKKYSDQLFDYHEVIIEFKGISLAYYFELVSKEESLFYGRNGFYKDSIQEEADMFIMANFSKDNLFTIPAWHQKAIVYQIFPDRFNRGSNFVLEDKYTEDWNGEVNYRTFLGGNLKGITEKLGYLEDLGINTIYLTPIFKSDSTHRYDTDDYYQIDPGLGTKQEFKELVDKAHQREIKIILDAVFNHCGLNFFAFDDLVKKGEESKYKDWFEVDSYPVTKERKRKPNYKTFGYYYHMPKLILSNQETAEYFLEVARYWTKEFNIDGWRLDVADEISPEFWREFRRTLKRINPDILISGEVWYDSDFWLKGDQFDTVMNYPFLEVVEDFFAKEVINVDEFSDRLAKIRSLYKKQAHENLWNLIDSHDVSRFLYKCENNLANFKLAILFQFTYLGIPVIYYGDEYGMAGGVDGLEKREAMVWEEGKQNQELFQYYKRLIRIRRENQELIAGEYSEVLKDREINLYGYKRSYYGQEMLIYLNNSNQNTILELAGSYRELLTDRILEGEITIKAKEGVVLKPLF
ncbi:glycosidase [Orenia metallireducens]|uniref:glycoside hydrolase family 13 protein n=1 Tax=Orenia metallireducens TaxID=1413210 RepID=UPI000D062D72|nr:glycoside hydrolase family 13 protein [Orenia metallireducens]PRX32599.1 glycosidase [Orenia metallireducens]